MPAGGVRTRSRTRWGLVALLALSALVASVSDAAAEPELSVTVDQGATQPDPTNATAVHFDVVFSDVVSDFDASDVQLSGTAPATVTNVTDLDGSSYDVEVTVTADGTVSASVPAEAAHDALGTGNQASTSSDDTVTVVLIGPQVTIDQAPGQTDPTSTSTVAFSVDFDGPVAGFDADDLEVAGTAGASSGVVSGGPASYIVTIGPVGSDGTVTLSVRDGAAFDLAGNASGPPTVVDGSITVDTTAPSTPTLTEPTPSWTTSDVTPRFRWTTSDDATPVTYRLLVDDSGCGFPTPEVDVSGLTATTVTSPATLARTTQCWQVIAADAVGNTTSSATQQFDIAAFAVTDYIATVGQRGNQVNVASYGKPCVADLNDDGRLDTVWSRHTKIPQDVYLANPDGTFTRESSSPWSVQDHHGCVVADFDRDTRPDIFVPVGACAGSCFKRDRIWMQQPDGRFLERGATFLGAMTDDRTRGATKLDVDRDGWMDLFISAVNSASGSHHRVMLNRGVNASGSWLGLAETPLGPEKSLGNATCVEAEDLDGDGWTEIIVCHGGAMSAYKNVGGSFVLHDTKVLASKIKGVHFADLDGDGDLDMALVRTTALEIRVNDGGGGFAAIAFSAPLLSGWDATSPDIDGDGDRDLFVTQHRANQPALSNGAHMLWLNSGIGTWQRFPVPQPAEGMGDQAQVYPNFDGSGTDAVLVGNGSGGNGSLLGPRQMIGLAGLMSTVAPPPPPPPPPSSVSLSVSDTSLPEGATGTKAAAFNVTLSNASSSQVTVKYKTTNGTAAAGSDYYAKALTTLTFAPGETSKTVSVSVIGDYLIEPNVVFHLDLSSPVGASLADGRGSATITNDDNPPGLAVSDVSVTEGAGGTKAATFKVTLSAASSSQVTVKYKTTNGSATAGSDYTAKPLTTLTFSAGQTTKWISVSVIGDTAVEPNEVFYLDLSAPVGASFNDPRGQGTIVNDD